MALPKLNFVHLCDNAFLSQDEKLNIIGIFSELHAAKFPFHQPRITVVANFALEPGEYKVAIRFVRHGAKEPVLTMEGGITSEVSKNINLIVNFQNIIFPDQREHTLEVLVDKQLLTSIPFNVKFAPRSANKTTIDSAGEIEV